VRRPRPRREAGFTLLEVLVVLVIIGIITSMAVVSTGVLGRDHEIQEEARRFVAVVGQAHEEAQIEGRDFGLRFDSSGYDFLEFDALNQRWLPVGGDPLLRARALPEGVRLELLLEDREIQLKPREAPTEQRKIEPQVLLYGSGELVAFELRLRREGTDNVVGVIGSVEGKVELKSAVDERAR
jgi:general secretion pathway protein H